MNTTLKSMFNWHRPLMAVALLMIVSTIICVAGLLVDPREVLGVPLWLKPLKFSLSILLYTVTWAWLIAQLPKWRRGAHISGTVIAITIFVEQVLILGAAAAGTTSHFNFSTELSSIIWVTMGVSIVILYLATLVTTIAVFFMQLPVRSHTLAVRSGAVVAIFGLGVAYLMTFPTADQLADFQGIAGAHTVGSADGGPGLPLLGWSTVSGDLRISHFVGMHALQLLPLFAILLTALGRRWWVFAQDRVQSRLVTIATFAYAATTVLVTLQALAGQSIVRPAGVFLIGGWAILLISVGLTTATLLAALRKPQLSNPEEVHA